MEAAVGLSATRPLRLGSLTRSGLELLALTGLAIAQPLLDVFSRAPDVFVRAGARPWEIVAFALVVALVPALFLWSVEIVAAGCWGETWRERVHLVNVGALFLLFLLHSLRSWFDLSEGALLAAAAIGAIAFAFLTSTVRLVRDWLGFAAVLPVVAVVLFLFTSPMSGLITSSGVGGKAVVVTPSAAPRSSLVVVVLDELPVLSLLDGDGNLDRARYPGFAALASGSRWFRNTTAVGDHTLFAVPAILTGRYPKAGKVAPTWSEYPDNMFRLFGGTYAMRVSEAVTNLCAPSYCRAPQPTAATQRNAGGGSSGPSTKSTNGRRHDGLGALLSAAKREYPRLIALRTSHAAPVAALGEETATSTTLGTSSTTGAPASVATGPVPTTALNGAAVNTIRELPELQAPRFAELLDGISRNETPTFHFLHVLMPHGPWHLFGSGAHHAIPPRELQIPGYDRGRWVSDPNAAAIERRRHLLQLAYTDALIGRLVQRLRSTKMWERSVVVVTADHGAGFTANVGFRTLDDQNQTEILGVPLFVHAPDFPVDVDDRPAQTIDVLPTVAELLKVRIPWPIAGNSLVGASDGSEAKSHPFGSSGDFDAEVRIRPVSVADHIDRLLRLAEERAIPAGDEDGDLGVLRSSPHGEWLGRDVDEFARSSDVRGRTLKLVFPSPSAFDDVDLASDVPALVEGTLTNGAGGDTVVIAVDGRIAGITNPFAAPGDDHNVVAILDPAALHAGRNHLEAFVVVGDHSLAPIRV